MAKITNGSAREILLDYDSMNDVPLLLARLPFICRNLNLKVKSCEFSVSSSGRGMHVVISFKEILSPLLIVCLQALCGSDFRRETFNIVRVRNLRQAPTFWQSRWNVLYSEKIRSRK